MSSSFFGSITSEQRWTDQFNEHFIIYIDNHASIFRVPKKVCDTKPEAYAPRQIGLGAYHHFRPDLDEMERRKLEAVKKFLKPEQYRNFKSLIVDKVKVLEPLVRACYSKYLDIDGCTLAWIMSIDGVYLLHRLSSYTDKGNVDSEDRKLAQELVMLENQMPTTVVKEILKAIPPPRGLPCPSTSNILDEEEEKDKGLTFRTITVSGGLLCPSLTNIVEEEEEKEKGLTLSTITASGRLLWPSLSNIVDEEEVRKKWLTSKLRSFCEAHTPLGLTDKEEVVRDTSNPHLLSYMYNLIVKNWSFGDQSPNFQVPYVLVACPVEVAQQFTEVARAAADLTGQKPLQLLASLPLQQLAALFKEDSKNGNSSIEEIHIPSASQLDAISNVQFKVWPNSGIGMKFDKKDRVMYLPVITLNADSEVILRNLVAYEVASASPGSTLILAGYVDFMCGIIDTAKDVDLLEKKGIIQSDLPIEEIAEIFNGISKSSSQSALPELEKATQDLNRVYDSTFRVRAWRFIRDHFIPSEDAVKLFFSILLILLLTLQAVCQVYGCSARWFGRVSSI